MWIVVENYATTDSAVWPVATHRIAPMASDVLAMFALSPAWITVNAPVDWPVWRDIVPSVVAATRNANRINRVLATSAWIPVSRAPAVAPMLCAASRSIAVNATAPKASRVTQHPNRVACEYQLPVWRVINVPVDTCALAISAICPVARPQPALWASVAISRFAARSATPATIAWLERSATRIAPANLAVNPMLIAHQPNSA